MARISKLAINAQWTAFRLIFEYFGSEKDMIYSGFDIEKVKEKINLHCLQSLIYLQVNEYHTKEENPGSGALLPAILFTMMRPPFKFDTDGESISLSSDTLMADI